MLSKGKKLAQMGAPKILPNLFDDGAVGLRIVAAMSADCIDSGQKPIKEKAKSDPIPIRARGPAVAAGHPAATMKAEVVEAEDGDGDVELSESYTCVISRVEGGAVRKRVYLDDGVVVDGICGKFEMNSGVFFESPTTTVGPIPGDFLSCCYLCRKKLHGLDIFMYRGDKAFCSAECRYQQILSDEHKEKCRSEARESRNSPLSPYLTPLSYDAGVAAA